MLIQAQALPLLHLVEPESEHPPDINTQLSSAAPTTIPVISTASSYPGRGVVPITIINKHVGLSRMLELFHLGYDAR